MSVDTSLFLTIAFTEKKKKMSILRKFLKNPINFLGILLIYKKNENMLFLFYFIF